MGVEETKSKGLVMEYRIINADVVVGYTDLSTLSYVEYGSPFVELRVNDNYVGDCEVQTEFTRKGKFEYILVNGKKIFLSEIKTISGN